MNANSKTIEKDTSAKHWLKLGRWRARRILTAAKWGSSKLAATPTVVGNAMPKSGSHLIIQVLQGLTELGPFVNPGFPPLNRTEDNRQLSDNAVLDNLSRMRSGDIGYGYIKAKPGEHYNAIIENLGVNNGTFLHHIKVLEKEGLVYSRRDGFYTRFYPTDLNVSSISDSKWNQFQRSIIEKRKILTRLFSPRKLKMKLKG